MKPLEPRYVVLANRIEFRPRCSECMDSGAIMAIAQGQPTLPYAFQCSCDAAQTKRRPYPRWASADKKAFAKIKDPL